MSPEEEAVIRAFVEGTVTVAAADWHMMENPIAVWAAIEVITQQGDNVPEWAKNYPMPGWIKDYLRQVAKRILAGQEAGQALGLTVKGGKGKLKQWQDAKSRHAVMGMCVSEFESGRHKSLEAVFEYVGGDKGIDPELVKKWWYAKHAWNEKPELP